MNCNSLKFEKPVDKEQTIVEKITLLIEWYDVQVRPFLEIHDKEKLAAIEKEKARLQQALQSCEEPFTVCLLGNSGIGKSTLINALLSGKGLARC